MCKEEYKRTMESIRQKGKVKEVWNGLGMVSGYKVPNCQLTEESQVRANELYTPSVGLMLSHLP